MIIGYYKPHPYTAEAIFLAPWWMVGHIGLCTISSLLAAAAIFKEFHEVRCLTLARRGSWQQDAALVGLGR